MRRVLAVIIVMAGTWLYANPSPVVGHLPDSFRYAHQLIPAVVDVAERIALGSALERRPPHYLAVATGKDEYVYELKDKIFIRRIKDRYETPLGRICGDFAVVRVELMDESMKTLPPIMAWYMIYRDDRWQKLIRNDEGRFSRDNFSDADLPPYAQRCFEGTDSRPRS